MRTLTSVDMPGPSATSVGGLSMTILTGTRCTILTQLPVAFSAGSNENAVPEPGWHAVFSGARIAMLKVLNAPQPAAVLRRRILDFLAREARPELADVAIVRGPADLDGRMPVFVSAFLEHVWRAT